MCGFDEQPRLRAADLERLADARREQLLAAGESLNPVVSRSRKLATRFWGSAWMRHLAVCESGGLCLAPGRTLLRHGCVLDIRVAPGLVSAKVSAEELYEIELRLAPPDEERVEALATLCAGKIDSLLSLLEGRVDEALLQQLCDPDNGLLPDARDWHISCSCPDWSDPCPHAAAAMYALGVLLDSQPELLFTLRSIDSASLLRKPESTSDAFDAASLSATFGIDLELE
jgi:uncharacterized Zn finger protein